MATGLLHGCRFAGWCVYPGTSPPGLVQVSVCSPSQTCKLQFGSLFTLVTRLSTVVSGSSDFSVNLNPEETFFVKGCCHGKVCICNKRLVEIINVP